jgi:ABC-type cobalamin/Fe3+-siderophores transport system ATPase subunit
LETVTLQDSITHSLAADRRVVLLVGPPGCGKSRVLREFQDVGIVNVGKELARELIPHAKEKRSEMALELLGQLIDSHTHSIVVLDNIELLFMPELKIDLWPALEVLSANKKLIVAWTGRVAGDQIQWGDPGVPGFRVMSLENCPANIVNMTG